MPEPARFQPLLGVVHVLARYITSSLELFKSVTFDVLDWSVG